MSKDLVMVTGASGFLASHIILKLLKDGFEVRGSVRSNAKADQIRQALERQGADTSSLSFVLLDLLKDEGWDAAMQDVKYLIHTASPFVTTIPKNPDVIIKPAVEGTSRAINAALDAGVVRIVLTSSMGAVCEGHPKSQTRTYSEIDWTNLDNPKVTPYYRSKTLAERKAWEIMDQAGRRDDLSVINPGFIMGPLLDNDAGTSGAIILKMMKGGFPGAPKIYVSVIDVRDAAEMHIKALLSDKARGQRFLIAGPPALLGDMARTIAETFPEYARKLPTRDLPDFVVRIAALLDADTKTAARSLGQRHELDSSKARKLFGRDFIDTKTATIAMAQSLIDMKLI